jgi:hypothetical protein
VQSSPPTGEGIRLEPGDPGAGAILVLL